MRNLITICGNSQVLSRRRLLTKAISIVQQRDHCLLMYDDNVTAFGLPNLSQACFSAESLPDGYAVEGQAQGRGTTLFIQYGQSHLVLRHYKRGGLVSKVSDDKFVFLGLARTRPFQELSLLKQMRDWQLPCPIPIGAQVKRRGLLWQGDILTGRIDGAKDVHQILMEKALSEIEWRHIGATIKRFHQRQVYHHDLNIHNVMLDNEGQAWLIDFDKCRIRAGDSWKQANLARLQRSLAKEYNRNDAYGFSSNNWAALMAGYDSY